MLGGGFIQTAVAARGAAGAAAGRRRRLDGRNAVRVQSGQMAREIDINTVAKAYARWAPVYDLVFGAVFDAGRKASIAAAQRIGGRILDVGIGTGISLPIIRTRIASSASTIPSRCCARRMSASPAHQLAHVDALAVMDAQHLGLPDGFFDVVVAQYVITAVPDPEAALDEFARVTKPGGEIILVNHLGAEAGLRRVSSRVCADGAPARLAAGIPLGAARAMGRAARRRARARTPRPAAARPFLADPVRAEGEAKVFGAAGGGWFSGRRVSGALRRAARAGTTALGAQPFGSSSRPPAAAWPGGCGHRTCVS